ncbi:MAG: hypothetical protein SCARUB_02000 [Candidatus Scalindua rubra]|uniref:Uncharacterized protein n=1 Tax=Candidatus Scalindua rubra TaxID=1872076 RepID=A0A1E3XD50_9BACT|nr:MAG: hypothetical protein SCARUB_02000 [Candidatus Scalindua rubra]
MDNLVPNIVDVICIPLKRCEATNLKLHIMVTKSVGKVLENLKLKIGKFTNSVTLIKSYKDDLKKLSEIIIKIQESWSGSWIGFHSNLYYKGYKKPKWNESFDSEWGSIHGISATWEEKSYEDISSFIDDNYKGKNLLNIQDILSQKVDDTKELQSNICTELSLIRDYKNFDKEIEILGKIENIKWGISQVDIIKFKMPKQCISRDSFAMSQGLKTPPHIQYQANVLSCLSVISDIENFIKLSQRLIRQIEIRENVTSEGAAVLDKISIVLNICKKFHFVARQLRNRFNNRPTLEIEDEYDVQDLLHSLLKIYFDDIRVEEWVPSYAGSSSRIDFLLKKGKNHY